VNDDEDTPVQVPRAKSSVSVKTAELLAQRIATDLDLQITNPQREHVGNLLQEWLEQQMARRMKLERESHEKTLKELAEVQAERNKLASLIARLP
jgi:hypothetical protein